MILTRYIYKEVLINTLVILLIFFTVAIGGRISAYLTEASLGNITAESVASLVFYRIPSVVEVILPTSYFLALVLTLGRMSVDSEMTILAAAGVGKRQIINKILILSCAIAFILAIITLYLRPASQSHVDQIWKHQKNLTDFDVLVPGRFQSLNKGRRIVFVEKKQDQDLQEVFMMELVNSSEGTLNQIVTRAKQGQIQNYNAKNDKFLMLKAGSRTELKPGNKASNQMTYDELAQKIEAGNRGYAVRRNAMSTLSLFKSENRRHVSELHSRISLILLVILISPLAIPLSTVDRRGGKFAKLLPAIFIILLYQGLLSVMKTNVDKGNVSALMSFYPLHILFAFIAFGSNLNFSPLKRFFRFRHKLNA